MVSGEVVRVSSVGTATSSTNFNPSHWRPWFGQTGAFSDPVALFRNLEGRNNIKLRRTVEELRGRTNFAAFWVANQEAFDQRSEDHGSCAGDRTPSSTESRTFPQDSQTKDCHIGGQQGGRGWCGGHEVFWWLLVGSCSPAGFGEARAANRRKYAVRGRASPHASRWEMGVCEELVRLGRADYE